MSNTHNTSKQEWETLQSAAKRTGYAYQTFKNWKCTRKLPFPYYQQDSDIRVKVDEVNNWMNRTKITQHEA